MLPWRLASGGLTSCLLGTGHLEKEKICLVGGKMRESVWLRKSDVKSVWDSVCILRKFEGEGE